jgi:hypothetical protein
MKELRIFRRAKNVNIWLPALVALSSLVTHFNYWLIIKLFRFMGTWSILVFGLIFAVGVWRYGVIRRGKWGYAATAVQAETEVVKSMRDQLRDLRNERADLIAEIPDASPARVKALTERVDKIDQKIGDVRGKLKELDSIT